MSESGGDDARPREPDSAPYSPPPSDFVPDEPWTSPTAEPIAQPYRPSLPAPRFDVDPEQTGPINPVTPTSAPAPPPASPPPPFVPAPPPQRFAPPPPAPPSPPGMPSRGADAPQVPQAPATSEAPWAPGQRTSANPPAYRPPSPYRPFDRPGQPHAGPADRPWAPTAGSDAYPGGAQPQSAQPAAAVPPAPAEPVPAQPTVVLPQQPRPLPLSDDELTDTLGIDAVVDDHEAPAYDMPPAASPLPRPPSSARHRRDEPDLTRLEAASSGAPLPPLPTAAGSGAGGAAPAGGDGSAAGDLPPRRTRRSEKRAAKQRRKAPWWELPVLVLVAILIAVLVKSFVVQPFYIPSASMEKTLHGSPEMGHDRILVNKPIYDIRDPHGGDIVVFHAPPGWDDEPASKPPSNPIVRTVRGFGQLVGFVPPDGLVLVKRVIATGGQGVKGDAQGNVYVSKNGLTGPWDKLTEPYVYESGTDTHAEFGPVVVPKGRLWVMGDHRNDSADSRFHCGSDGSQGSDGAGCDPKSSTVPVSDVIGKAVVVAWPPSHWRTLGTPTTFKHLAAGAPLLGGAAFVTPVFLLRRRRRRRS